MIIIHIDLRGTTFIFSSFIVSIAILHIKVRTFSLVFIDIMQTELLTTLLALALDWY